MPKSLLGFLAAGLALGLVFAAWPARGQEEGDDACVTCHAETTPHIVRDWRQSAHAQAERMRASCPRCHGTAHDGPENVSEAKLPTARTCRLCHLAKFRQYEKGKHALAWQAMNALPMTHRQPDAEIRGMKGCGGCHKVGLLTAEDIAPHRFSGNGCSACHGRHRFSGSDARHPRLCSRCHTGMDHPQWEMWSTSAHGTAWQGEGGPERAPSCQTCHFPGGSHENITAWGFLAVRLPEEDEAWWKDRQEILKALGVLDAGGRPGPLAPLVEKLELARTSAEAFAALREKQKTVCRRCHGAALVDEKFRVYDQTLREADRLFARAVRVVAGLYADGVLEPRPDAPVKGYPFVLDFYEAPTAVEQMLYVAFEEYRMRAFQGAFHDNWDYQHWRGWAKLKKAVVDIEEKARAMRTAKKK